MQTIPVHHATFVIERTYPAALARVWAAWTSREAKGLWFAGPPGWQETERVFDVRAGGRETLGGIHPGGKVSYFDALYHEVLPEQRLLYSYSMHVDGKHLSVSLATVEFAAAAGGTRLKVTEQGAYFGGPEDATSREQGTNWLLDRVGQSLQAAA